MTKDGTEGKTAFDILKNKLQVFLLNTLKDSVKGNKIIYVEVDGEKRMLKDIFTFKDNFSGGKVIENAQAALTNYDESRSSKSWWRI